MRLKVCVKVSELQDDDVSKGVDPLDAMAFWQEGPERIWLESLSKQQQQRGALTLRVVVLD